MVCGLAGVCVHVHVGVTQKKTVDSAGTCVKLQWFIILMRVYPTHRVPPPLSSLCAIKIIRVIRKVYWINRVTRAIRIIIWVIRVIRHIRVIRY